MLLFLAFTKLGMVMILLTLILSRLAQIPRATWLGGALTLTTTVVLSFKFLRQKA